MVNDCDSWCDSDDIDSDLEQEAYALLYSRTIDVTQIYYDQNDKMNNSLITANSNENLEIINSTSDNFDKSINLSSSSAHSNDDNISLDSDSDDDNKFIKKMKYANPVNTLTVCISSDDDESDAIVNSVNVKTQNNSTLDSIDDKTDDESNDDLGESTSLINNVNFGTFQPLLSDVDKLFTDSPQTDGEWSVNFKPFSKSKYGGRYFESGANSTCSTCSKKGHSEFECIRSGPVCILCGNEGHISKHCDHEVCCVCLQKTHASKNCPFTANFLRCNCKRCGQRGHTDKICPDVWRQYKYTTVVGPPVLKTYSSQNKSNVYCANCAKNGHFTEQCPRSRMHSRFVGPPPIVEILQFDNADIYSHSRLSYLTKPIKPVENVEEPMASFLKQIDVTAIVENDKSQPDEPVDNSQFGHNFIMLSPIKPISKDNNRTADPIGCSTPMIRDLPQRRHIDLNNPKKPTKLPGITSDLLKKLFPDETRDHDKLPPALRKKLRKQLKKLIDHGYLPGDANMTQERMEFWLQEISTGRSLSYRDKKKLLGSVSAALHSISDRVSATDMISSDNMEINTSPVQCSSDFPLSMQESRKRRNKLSRQEKNLKNVLKVSRKEKKEKRKIDQAAIKAIKQMENQLKMNSSIDNKENLRKNKFKRRKRSSMPSEISQMT